MAEERLGASFSIDITQLQAGLKTANKLIRESQSEFKAAAAGMDDWTKSESGLNSRLQSLNKITQVQQQKVNALKANYQQLINDGLDPASDRAVQLRTQINNEEAALERNKAEVKKCTNALNELGEESLETGDEVEQTEGKLEGFGEVAAKVGKVVAAAAAAIGAAMAAVAKAAVESYAEYEQLVGGVETLFGAGGMSVEEYAKSVGKSVDQVQGEYNKLQSAQDAVIKNANNAYKTAGMSANEYMQNVTSFSASLISSLGGDTEKAAAAADMAMTDISDNANKMGTDMQSIVDTYQSLARGNFQMLDNLKLGYGGTKSEMERLIADANKVKQANGEMADLSIDSFADMTEAIHIIQDEMGITGTTAKEASSTISGSVGMAKASWQNLLTGIADDKQDFDLLINNFVESVTTAANNLLPRIATALQGVVKLVEKLVPMIPPLIEQFLPIVIEGVMTIVDGIAKIFPAIIDAILAVVPQLLTALIGMLPTIVETITTIIVQVMNALSVLLPEIVNAIIEIIPLLINSLLAAIPQLLHAAITLLMAIVQALPTIVQNLVKALPTIINSIVSFLTNNISPIISAAVQLFFGIIKAIPQITVALVRELPTIITAIVNGIIAGVPAMLEAGKELIRGLWNGIKDMAGWIGEKIKGFGKGILNSLKNFFGIKSPSKLMENVIGKNLALGIGKGFEKNIGDVNAKIQNAIQPSVTVNGGAGGTGKSVVVNQYNTYSQPHSRYELYKSKQQTAAAVRLALGSV